MMTTSCQDCVFAQKIVLGDSSVQTGCRAGRLEKYISRPGIRVLERTEGVSRAGMGSGSPDGTVGEKTFKVIEGSACLYNRSFPWLGTAENARDEMKSGMKIRLFVVAEGPDPEQVFRSIKAAKGFWKVSVLPGANPPQRPQITRWMRDNVDIEWTLDWWWGSPKPWGEILDDAINGCKSTYYVVIRSGTELPDDFVAKLKRVVVEEEVPLIAAETDSYFVVQSFSHRQVRGNAPAEAVAGSKRTDSVLDKLRVIEQERGEMIVRDGEEVFGG